MQEGFGIPKESKRELIWPKTIFVYKHAVIFLLLFTIGKAEHNVPSGGPASPSFILVSKVLWHDGFYFIISNDLNCHDSANGNS